MSTLLSDVGDECSDRWYRKLESFSDIVVIHSYVFQRIRVYKKWKGNGATYFLREHQTYEHSVRTCLEPFAIRTCILLCEPQQSAHTGPGPE